MLKDIFKSATARQLRRRRAQMINQKCLEDYFAELLVDVAPGDTQVISQRVFKFLRFTVERYESMDSETRASVDKIFRNIKEYSPDALLRLPDAMIQRQLTRLQIKQN